MGWDMLIGRFLMMIPVLALAGNLAQKKSVPPSPGTFPVNTALFAVLLVGVVVIVGALTFFPALSLGPILEHLLLQAGQVCSNRIHTASGRRRNGLSWLKKRVFGTRKSWARRWWIQLSQARSALDGQEPGDVCGGSGQRAHHGAAHRQHHAPSRQVFGFNLQITLWLWFTVLFANFAEAMAEGRGKAQADTLRKAKGETIAKRYTGRRQL